MPAASTWTCGCGTSATAQRCPTCGWDQGAAGQPDRSARRWVPLASALLVGTLAVDGVVAARGLGDVTAHVIEDHRDEASAFVPFDPPVDLGEQEGSAALEDLGALLPPELAGWERVDAPGVTGPLSLEVLTEGMWQGSELDVGRARLRDAGFRRAHGAAFVAGDRLLGATLWEFDDPAGARRQLADQATLASIDDSIEVTEVTLVDDAVAFTYEEEGDAIFEVWYRVEELIVNEYVIAPGQAGEDDLRVLHDAIAALVAS